MRVVGTDGRQSDEDYASTINLLQEAAERLGSAISAEDISRERAYDDLRHLDGQQWPTHIKRQREQMGRPCLTLNRLPQFVDQVIGDARQNRPSIRVKTAPVAEVNQPQRIPSIRTPPAQPPAMPGAPPAPPPPPKEYTFAEVMGGIIRDIEAQSRAGAVYDTGLEHSASIGWGNWRIDTEYDEYGTRGEQNLRIRRILNPFSVYWDTGATEPCKEDARWCMVTSQYPRDEFDRLYPEAVNSSGGDLATGLGDVFNRWFADDSVRVAEYFRKVPVKRTMLTLSDGSVIEHDEDFEKIADELERFGIYPIHARKVQSHKVEWYLITGSEILDQRELPGKYIPIVFCGGKELYIDGRMIYRGVIRHGKDAQQQFNYWMTAETERVALAPKAPYTIGASQVGTYENIWRTANTENHGFLPYDDTKNQQPPQRVQPPTISPGEHNLVMMADANIKATIGMYDASLGARSNETSGRAIVARQREGDTVTFPYIDNWRRAVAHTGVILVDLIPRIYDTERIVRILGVNGEEDFVAINKTIIDEETGEEVRLHDLSQARYAVETTTGPAHATARAEAADSMAQFIQAINNPTAAMAVGHIIARNMDWPGADDMADALQRVAVQMGLAEPDPNKPQQPTAQDQARAQAQQAQLSVEQGKHQAEMAKAQAGQAQAQASMADAQAKIIDARTKMAGAGQAPAQRPPAAQPNIDARMIRALVRDSVAEAIAELVSAQRGRAA